MAYQPIPGGSATISVTASNVQGTFPNPGKSGSMVYIVNQGTVAIAYRLGIGAQTATLADAVLGAGQSIFVAKGQGVDSFAAIGFAAGPTAVSFSAFDGNCY